MFSPEMQQQVHEGIGEAKLTIGVVGRRTGEWLRRRSVDVVNGGLGVGAVVLGSIALTTITNNPHLSSLLSNNLPYLQQCIHIPFLDFQTAAQDAYQLASQSAHTTYNDLREAGPTDLIKISISSLWSIVVDRYRQKLNIAEHERRFANGQRIRIRDMFPRIREP